MPPVVFSGSTIAARVRCSDFSNWNLFVECLLRQWSLPGQLRHFFLVPHFQPCVWVLHFPKIMVIQIPVLHFLVLHFQRSAWALQPFQRLRRELPAILSIGRQYTNGISGWVLLWTHAQRCVHVIFCRCFFKYFFMAALVGQTAERIFTKLSHEVDIRCYLRTYTRSIYSWPSLNYTVGQK